MQITQQANRITLRAVPWQGLLFGPLLWVLAIGLGSVMWTKSTLECDRNPPGQCVLTQSNGWGEKREQFAVQQLQAASVEANHRRSGNSRRTSYKVVLQIGDSLQEGKAERELPLTPYSDFNSLYRENQASQINRFIQNPGQAQLRIRDDSYFVAVFVFAFMAFGGTGLILASKVVIWEFDRQAGWWKSTRIGLQGKKVDQYSLGDIAGIQLQSTTSSSSRSRSEASNLSKQPSKKDEKTYLIAVVLQSGKSVLFTAYSDSNKQKMQKVVDQMHSFLRLKRTLPNEQTGDGSPEVLGEAFNLLIGGKEKRHDTIAQCQSKLSQDPYDAETYKTLAMAWMTQGDKAQAIQTLKTGRARLMRRGEVEKAQSLDRILQQFGLETE